MQPRQFMDFQLLQLDEKAMKGSGGYCTALMKQKGEKFPDWALDQAGIEVMFGNRIFMGPGLSSPRFRWVSYVDALIISAFNKS